MTALARLSPQETQARTWLLSMDSRTAATQIARMVRQMPMASREAAIMQLQSYRSDWTPADKARLAQFAKRECAPAGCACKHPPPTTPHDEPDMYPNTSYTPCGQFHGPTDARVLIDLEAQTSCEVANCAPGTSHGLRRVPFSIELTPSQVVEVEVGFPRSAHLVALTFLPAALDYDPRNWYIAGFENSSQTQAWELYREKTTFGRPSYNPNEDRFPLQWWVENGDDDISALIHDMNFLPEIIPPVDIGEGQASARYTLELAATPSNETVRGFHWVYFPKKGAKA